MLISGNIHALKIPFQIAVGSGKTINRFVYLYLIYGDKIYVIDTGVAGSENIIFDYIKETGRKIEEITTVILTHSHPDHIGSASVIREKTGCKVIAHAAEKPWIEDIDLQKRERPVPGFDSLVGGSVTVDRVVEDGEVIDIKGGPELRVIFTPGHSKGSLSVFANAENVLFCGDSVLLPGQMPIYEDISASISSLEKLKDIEGVEILLSSWDDPRKGDQVHRVMSASAEYFEELDWVVKDVAGQSPAVDPMELCALVLKEMSLPEIMLNPLVVRSFQSSLAEPKDI